MASSAIACSPILLRFFDETFQIRLCLLQVLDAVLGVIAADVLDDVADKEVQPVGYDEVQRLDGKAGIVRWGSRA